MAKKLDMECSLKRTDEENCSGFESRIGTCYKGLILPFWEVTIIIENKFVRSDT